MLKHKFGIMQEPPQKGEKFYNYSPQRFNCISVNDDFIMPLLSRLKNVRCCWHTLERQEFGLAYCGITLIPPESLDLFMETIWCEPNLSDLLELLSKARKENKYVIHYGI
ncbi:MAG: hypothetical protein IJR59_01295 [Firmicutes bacterium]|nr:hypothetical protein [Bacillota bacterium]